MDPADRADSTYVIRSGHEALDRLELLARLCWPSSAAFLARKGADRVDRFLDVGCGIGDVACRMAAGGVGTALGIDVNADVVDAATERAQRLGSSAGFQVAALAELGGEPGVSDFDVVYARCVISHLADPAAAVACMIAGARPSGSILIEDVEVAAVWSSPRNAAMTRYLELYVAAALGLGARPDVAPELAGLLEEAGATDVEVDVIQPVLRDPADQQIHARTMEAIAGPVVAQGLATQAEVDDLVAQLDAFAATPGVVSTNPRFVQVSARAPR